MEGPVKLMIFYCINKTFLDQNIYHLACNKIVLCKV